MTIAKTSKWLMVCLYYNEPWEEFLVRGVKPYVDVVMQTGIAECYYFQRSWERGPHIRLWFKGNADLLEKMLKPNLEEHFKQYFESKPSLRIDPDYPDNFPDNYYWHPNNSLQYIEHFQDEYRFGEPVVLFIMQKQFQASSETILNSIKNKMSRWTFDESISNAIKLHFCFAFATGMDLKEMRRFFELMSESWQPDSALNQPNSIRAVNKQQQAKMTQSFEQIYALQKDNITSFAGALWESLEQDYSRGNHAFEDWIHCNINVNIELGLVQEANKLGEKRGGYPLNVATLSDAQAPLWEIYADLVHLTNNRLGINGRDEGYLFYLIKTSLTSIIQEQKGKPTKRWEVRMGMAI